MQGGSRWARFNWLLFLPMVALVAIGTVFIHSAGAAREAVFHGMWLANLKTALFGFAVYFALAFSDYRRILKWLSPPAYLAAVALLVAVLFVGDSVYGGRRWLWFFQPSEIAKLCVIAFLAQLFGAEELEWRGRGGFGGFLAAAAAVGVPSEMCIRDRVYPVDPRIVPEVKEGIPTMTYREMRELAYAGFGVFNDDAVIPAVRARIPINIRNTNHPSEPGTMIQQSRRVVPGTVVGIASADGFCNIIVEKYLMNRQVGFGRRLLQVLEDEGIAYEHMPSGVDSQCVVVKGQFLPKEKEHRIIQAIKRELEPDYVAVERDITILMIVGEGMCYTAGMFAKACLALASAGISMSMVNQGSSEVSFMIAIRRQDRDVAVRALYKAFFG